VALVVMKIIKHYQEEGQGSELVQGVLLGLVVEDRLEITNCFPFPQHTEDDADFDEVQYQMEMMRSLRHVNIDHLHVGWYQSTFYGSFVTRALLDSQFSYQHAIEESVVLIYDPIKTAQGSLYLKAYRLTPKLMEICKEKDFSADGLKKASVGNENMFEEVPIVIKNSHLINVLLWELEDKSTAADKHELLNLSSSPPCLCFSLFLSLSLYSVPSSTPSRFLSFSLSHAINCSVFALNFIFLIFFPIYSLGQINTYCQTIKEFTSQNLGKLFMAEALQGTSS
uniref:Eukaryotic translation initiation factor 3 subunit H n=1 Tax=Sinocyclocheilus rhinocerous TaxID=307959 RepID=A0A673JC71_9TELE